MNIKKINIGEQKVEVEIDFFQLMLEQWSATMTRDEIEQFVVDACVNDLT